MNKYLIRSVAVAAAVLFSTPSFAAGYIPLGPKIYTPQPDLEVRTPQPDVVTPQPDVITPQPALVTPQPDLVTVTPGEYVQHVDGSPADRDAVTVDPDRERGTNYPDHCTMGVIGRPGVRVPKPNVNADCTDLSIATQGSGDFLPATVVSTPQPDLVTPQPDLVTPQPDVVTPQPDLVTYVPQPPTCRQAGLGSSGLGYYPC